MLSKYFLNSFNSIEKKNINLIVNLPRAPAWSLSCVEFFVTPWTIAHQAPLSMGFPRQEHCE